MGIFEINWPDVSTVIWDQDALLDTVTGRRGALDGSLSQSLFHMTYRFDRAIGCRSGNVLWTAAYTNRATKAILMKNGHVHRELNRSFYCADDYDYPIAIGTDGTGRVVVTHCPHEFNLLEIEDAETGTVLVTLKSRDMEFHSRLDLSADGRFLLDAGWFWHPWCGACVFEVETDGNSLLFSKRTAFASVNEIDSAAFSGNSRVVVSSAANYYGEEPEPGSLGPKELGVWSLLERRWESKADLAEPTGMIMPWKEWIVSFYDHPKLIEIATGKIVHRWDHLHSGKQIGPIDLGDPPPPPIALDPRQGRFAVANSARVVIVTL